MELKLYNIEDFINLLNGNNVTIDDVSWIDPFAIIMLKVYKKYTNRSVSVISTRASVHSYIRTILQDNIPSNSFSYVSIQEISYTGNEHIVNAIVDKTTNKIALNQNMSCMQDRQDIQRYLKYTISEMIDNVTCHSQSNGIQYVAAQYYSQLRKVQVVIVDNGIGFKKSLELSYNPSTEEEAISLAIQKEVTGSNTLDQYGHPRHAGLGLFFLKRMMELTNGTLIIVSNSTIYVNVFGNENYINTNSNWKGSAIIFEFKPANIDYEYEQIMNVIRYEVYDNDESEVFSF